MAAIGFKDDHFRNIKGINNLAGSEFGKESRFSLTRLFNKAKGFGEAVCGFSFFNPARGLNPGDIIAGDAVEFVEFENLEISFTGLFALAGAFIGFR